MKEIPCWSCFMWIDCSKKNVFEGFCLAEELLSLSEEELKKCCERFSGHEKPVKSDIKAVL